MATPKPPVQNIPGMTAPLLDVNTGYVTRSWYLFFVSVYRGLGIPIPFSFYGSGAAGQDLQIGVAIADPCYFPPDFLGSSVVPLVAPTVPVTITVNRLRGSVTTIIGTITINSISDIIFQTQGNVQQNLLTGDVLQLVYSAPLNVSITLRANRN